MTVTFQEITIAAKLRLAPVTGETAGYLMLAFAESMQHTVGVCAPSRVLLNENGTVSLAGLVEAPAERAEQDLRDHLRRLLDCARSVAPALRRAADQSVGSGPSAVRRDLEAALIPLNRAAARRGLCRLWRETARAKERGKLAAALEAAERDQAAELCADQASRSEPALATRPAADFDGAATTSRPASPPAIATIERPPPLAPSAFAPGSEPPPDVHAAELLTASPPAPASVAVQTQAQPELDAMAVSDVPVVAAAQDAPADVECPAELDVLDFDVSGIEVDQQPARHSESCDAEGDEAMTASDSGEWAADDPGTSTADESAPPVVANVADDAGDDVLTPVFQRAVGAPSSDEAAAEHVAIDADDRAWLDVSDTADALSTCAEADAIALGDDGGDDDDDVQTRVFAPVAPRDEVHSTPTFGTAVSFEPTFVDGSATDRVPDVMALHDDPRHEHGVAAQRAEAGDEPHAPAVVAVDDDADDRGTSAGETASVPCDAELAVLEAGNAPSAVGDSPSDVLDAPPHAASPTAVADVQPAAPAGLGVGAGDEMSDQTDRDASPSIVGQVQSESPAVAISAAGESEAIENVQVDSDDLAPEQSDQSALPTDVVPQQETTAGPPQVGRSPHSSRLSAGVALPLRRAAVFPELAELAPLRPRSSGETVADDDLTRMPPVCLKPIPHEKSSKELLASPTGTPPRRSTAEDLAGTFEVADVPEAELFAQLREASGVSATPPPVAVADSGPRVAPQSGGGRVRPVAVIGVTAVALLLGGASVLKRVPSQSSTAAAAACTATVEVGGLSAAGRAELRYVGDTRFGEVAEGPHARFEAVTCGRAVEVRARDGLGPWHRWVVSASDLLPDGGSRPTAHLRVVSR